ncbi:MAG: polysaccharide deacetylase family protein [Saprospiraceae bacterium]|nr:polysaccharide deacetylase family protein [Saprospiraceae bacterium]
MDQLPSDNEMLVYLEQPNPRIRYTIEVLLFYILQIPFKWETDLSTFVQSKKPKINYGRQRITAKEIYIPAHEWIQSNNLLKFPPYLFKYNKIPILFHLDTPDADLPFDVVSAAFFLLARVEEYEPFSPDSHGRFPAKEALMVRKGFQELPIVDIWAQLILEEIRKKNAHLHWAPPNFSYQATYDVDLPWKYLHRTWWRSFAGLAKSLITLQTDQIFERFQVWMRNKPDPYFTFPQIFQLHQSRLLKPVFFIPVGEYGPFDKNMAANKPAYRQLIRKLADQYPIGLHPSYRSLESPNSLARESGKLEAICGNRPVKSRNHYLRFRLPETYRQLLTVGIREDYSMGFAEMPGFRAGTAYAFPWFDLEKNCRTDLMVHPFSFMDVSLKNQLQLSPETALKKMQSMARTVQKTGGTLISIWHNNSLEDSGDWVGWNKLYTDWLRWIEQEII